jgi:Zn-dependent peptidase ImmA (M78 family)
MMATELSKSPLPINPAVLAWARIAAGLTIEEAATKAGVSPDRLEAWENVTSTRSPTVRQARRLAEIYERPFLEFFQSKPPTIKEYDFIPDFRLYRGATNPHQTVALKKIQTWVEVQRVNALDLYEEIGETPPNFPSALFGQLENDPELVASRARDALNFRIEKQLSLRSDERDNLPNILRSKIEAAGVLTFKLTALADVDARGLCLAQFPLPVIAFSKESPRAQAFTLAHELAHLALRQSAVSGDIPRVGGTEPIRRVEQWCNRFASAFLMPEHEVLRIFPRPTIPAPSIDDDFLRRIANKFSVSDHAALIRLVHLKLVDAEFYWATKKPQLDAAEKAHRGGGKSKYYGTRYKNKLGNHYTSLVLQAWSTGRITNHKAAEFMGIKNLKHLHDIRAER